MAGLRVKFPLLHPLRLRRAKGFGVHSPFAFSMITSTLAPGDRYYVYDDIESMKLSGDRRRLLKLIVRLLARFNPGSVRVCGSDEAIAGLVAAQCPSAVVVTDESDCRLCEMVIVADGRGLKSPLHRGVAETQEAAGNDAEGIEVTVFTDLKQQEQRVAWKRLKESRRAMTFTGRRSGVAVRRRGLPPQSFNLLF